MYYYEQYRSTVKYLYVWIQVQYPYPYLWHCGKYKNNVMGRTILSWGHCLQYIETVFINKIELELSYRYS